MIDQTYCTRSLLRLLTRADPKRYPLGRNRAEYRQKLTEINESISADDFKFSQFNCSIRNGKRVYIAADVKDVFALRKLNDNLSKTYRVRQADRHAIVRQVISLLGEKVEFYVARRDISEFFESIQRSPLIDKILQDQLLCYRSREHLRNLFQGSTYFSPQGLPRGLGVSATLAELYLGEFDQFARSLPGVYFYARFVDDLIFFSHRPPSSFIPSVETYLSENLKLKFNVDITKHTELEFNKNGVCASAVKELSYLGYRFVFSSDSKGRPILHTQIAPNKLRKLKRRIMLSIFAFVRDGDYQLLKDRIAFLSGNHRLKSDRDNRSLMAGIYYNYSLIDEIGVAELKQLSRFLNKALNAANGSLGRALRTRLTAAQRKELGKYCFHAGFTKRISHNFGKARMGKINACWKYA